MTDIDSPQQVGAMIPTPRGPDFAPPEQTPTKVCRRCAVQTKTDGAFCPHCGAAYATPIAGRRRLSKKVLALAACVSLLLAGGVVATLKIRADHAAAHRKAVAAAAASKQAAAERDAARLQAEEDARKRTVRAESVSQMQGSILTDARARANPSSSQYAYLKGPISHVACTPLGGGSVDDLTALTGTFECIAVNETAPDGTERGYRFAATMNWTTGAYTWHLGN